MPELLSVSKRFGEKQIVSDFSLKAPEDRVLCLFGPSGCGKTTLLRLFSGLLAPDSGRALRAKNIRESFLFQEDRLLPWLDALGNLTAVGICENTARSALEAVGLSGEEHTLPADLSGGMRRRLSIARAAAFGGDYLYLDEPLRGLDAAAAALAVAQLKGALQNRGGLLITHNLDEAFRLADELLLLSGPPVSVCARLSVSDFGSAQALEEALQRLRL